MRTSILAAALALASWAPFTASAAVADTDPRWLPWIGCWQSASERAVAPDARVCFVPTSDGHVQRVVITEGDASVPSAPGQPLIADGIEHPLVVPECTGQIRVDWSADGRRYFTSSERSCIDEVAARSSGLALLSPGPALIEVEAVEASGRETVRVHRYRRVAVPSSLSASLPADVVARADAAAEQLSTMRLTVAHIIDASSRVHPHALEATVLETNTPFLLNVAGLRALSTARVDEDLIDLMIAVSYPEHFAIDQPSGGSGFSDAHGSVMAGTMWDQLPAACYYPYFDPAFCYGSSTFLSYAYRYYETPYYAPPSVIVTPRPPIAPGGPPLSSGQARAINGQGYTRVRESEPASPPSSNGSRATSNSSARSAPRASSDSGSNGGSSSGSSSSDSSSSGSSSTASSGGGYSSGGGGGDTGRTAVPR